MKYTVKQVITVTYDTNKTKSVDSQVEKTLTSVKDILKALGIEFNHNNSAPEYRKVLKLLDKGLDLPSAIHKVMEGK
ncbi:hypothetical protein ACU8V4_13740 [Pseudoalteromonas mariniglutinosa]